MIDTQQPRRRGRIPGPPMVKTNVNIEPDIADWAKRQPGGLAFLVRKLLREAYERDRHRGGSDAT